MERAKKGGRSVTMQVKIWWSPKKRSIELRGEGRPASFISTVHADPKSARGNPNLYWKLADCLREAGAPAPEKKPTLPKRK